VLLSLILIVAGQFGLILTSPVVFHINRADQIERKDGSILEVLKMSQIDSKKFETYSRIHGKEVNSPRTPANEACGYEVSLYRTFTSVYIDVNLFPLLSLCLLNYRGVAGTPEFGQPPGHGRVCHPVL
jgi:hypothetical protein